MHVQLTQRGAALDVAASELAELQRQFDERYCVVLPGFLEPTLLARLQDKVGTAAFFDKYNVDVGPELRMRSDPASTALEFLMNDPRLHAFVRDVTAIGPIGCFRGRVYSLMPNTDQRSDWHDDMIPGRLATLVINLSTEVYEGGVLQFRRADSEVIATEVHNTGFGDATLFKIEHGLKHRVTPTTGRHRRTVYAGWFLREPDFVTLLRERLDSAAAEA